MSAPTAPDFSDRPVDLEVPVVATALTWMAIHGYLCLALRHPGVQGSAHPSRVLAQDFVEHLGEHLVEIGLLTAGELAEAQRLEVEEQARCEVCGCTDAQACPGGCCWDPRFAKAGRAVCSRCTDRATPLKTLLTPEDPAFGATLQELQP